MEKDRIPKILIIENEMIIAADMSVQFLKMGYEVIGIHMRAEDALKTIADDPPDIVLMDIGLKGKMDGITAAGIISDQYHIPIVFLSSGTDMPTFHRAMTIRPYAFISKPFLDEDLQRAIEHTLDRMEETLFVEGFYNSCKLFAYGKVYLLIPTPLEV